VQCLLDVGFGVIEITMTIPGALRVIEKFAARALIGAGTCSRRRRRRMPGRRGPVPRVARFASGDRAHRARRGLRGADRRLHADGSVRGHHERADIVRCSRPPGRSGASRGAAFGVPGHPAVPHRRVTLANMGHTCPPARRSSAVAIDRALDALERADLDAVRAHAAAYRGKAWHERGGAARSSSRSASR